MLTPSNQDMDLNAWDTAENLKKLNIKELLKQIYLTTTKKSVSHLCVIS